MGRLMYFTTMEQGYFITPLIN